MNPQAQDQWKAQALDLIFEALAASKTLEGRFAFKGARVLAKRLGGAYRQSYDIDMNLTDAFVKAYPDPVAQARCLQEDLTISLDGYFRAQNPIRYQLRTLKISRQPPKDHPRGWNAFSVRINLDDLKMAGVIGLPPLELDIAAPEDLGPKALAPMAVGAHEILAYTLERIAGEKLRAFLSSLPTYRAKVKKPGDAVRAKDLYDLMRIAQARPLSDVAFWRLAGEEFQRACASRLIDCRGLTSFEEEWEVTRATYSNDAIIPKDISFDRAWSNLLAIVEQFSAWGVVPFEYPLPESR